jgi:carboxylesterase
VTDVTWHSGSNAVIYLIHGITGTPAEMGFVAAGLVRQGWDVCVPTLPGHCARLRDLVKTNESDWRAQVYRQISYLREQYDFVFAAGLSAGALLALDAAVAMKVDGLGVLSPTFMYDGWNTPWSDAILPLCIKIVPRFLQPLFFHVDGSPYGVKDEVLREKIRGAYNPWAAFSEWVHVWWPWNNNDDVPLAVSHGYPLFPLRTLTEVDRLIRRVRGSLEKVTAPTVILQAKDDDMTGPANARLVYDSIRSSNKSLIILDDCYHVITVDKQKKEVIRRLNGFFASCRRENPSTAQVTSTAASFP